MVVIIFISLSLSPLCSIRKFFFFFFFYNNLICNFWLKEKAITSSTKAETYSFMELDTNGASISPISYFVASDKRKREATNRLHIRFFLLNCTFAPNKIDWEKEQKKIKKEKKKEWISGCKTFYEQWNVSALLHSFIHSWSHTQTKLYWVILLRVNTISTKLRLLTFSTFLYFFFFSYALQPFRSLIIPS